MYYVQLNTHILRIFYFSKSVVNDCRFKNLKLLIRFNTVNYTQNGAKTCVHHKVLFKAYHYAVLKQFMTN